MIHSLSENFFHSTSQDALDKFYALSIASIYAQVVTTHSVHALVAMCVLSLTPTMARTSPHAPSPNPKPSPAHQLKALSRSPIMPPLELPLRLLPCSLTCALPSSVFSHAA